MSFVVVAALSLSAFAAPRVNPEVVPATGETSSIIRVDRADMYRFEVESDVDVSCSLADTLRGRFKNNRRGQCRLDVLLDPGVYKAKATFHVGTNATGDVSTSATKAGRARVRMTAFVEDAPRTQLLARGSEIRGSLAEGHQRSFWIDVPKRGPVQLTIAGRTAGAVKLWRDGEWLENTSFNSSKPSPRPGQSIHRWNLDTKLEAGRYRVSVYGTNVSKWTKDAPKSAPRTGPKSPDALFVVRGSSESSETGSAPFTLPAWGFHRVVVPHAHVATTLILDKATTTVVSLRARPIGKMTFSSRGSGQSCRVTKSTTSGSCGVISAGGGRTILEVSGPPGTTGLVLYNPMGKKSLLRDGESKRPNKAVPFAGPSQGSRFLVASHDSPPDDDGAPLSCSLQEITRRNSPVATLAADFPKVNASTGLERAFNYRSGPGAHMWFQVERAGTYAISTAGKLKSACEVFSISDTGKTRRVANDDGATKRGAKKKTCSISKFLAPGRYEFRMYNGRSGVETMRIAPDAATAAGKKVRITAGKSSCQISDVKLKRGRRYRLMHNRTGRLTSRGLILRSLPLSLDRGLTLSASAAAPLSVEVGKRPVVIRSLSGGGFRCSVDDGRAVASRNGVCSVSPKRAGARLKVTTKSERTLSLFIDRKRPNARAGSGPSSYSPPRPTPPTRLRAEQVRHFSFDRAQSRTFLVDVPRSGLYRLQTTGLLSTDCRLRTRTVQSLYRDAGSGRGRNCLLQGALRPGEYLLTVVTKGKSTGRAGVHLEIRKPQVIAPLRLDNEQHVDVAAGTLVRQAFVVGEKDAGGQVAFAVTTPSSIRLKCRLEDDDGWPVSVAPHSCSFSEKLGAGRYRLFQMPLTVESARAIRAVKTSTTSVTTVKPRTPLEINKVMRVRLAEAGKDTFVFQVPAAMGVDIALTDRMQARLFKLSNAGARGELVSVIPPSQGGHTSSPFRFPVGHKQSLDAGAYVLETEHALADVGIRYSVGIRALDLAPGLSRPAQTGGSLTVRNPSDGYVRIRAHGEVDTRCRLFDSAGKIVGESRRATADWNCALTLRLARGEYRLVLESESRRRRQTVQVAMTRPKTRDLGSVTNGAVLRPKADTVTFLLPFSKTDVVEDVRLQSDAPFSCTLEELSGKVLARHSDVTTCPLLVWPGPRTKERPPFRVRVWQTADSDGVRLSRRTRAVRAFSGGSLGVDRAGLAVTEVAGRYRTGPNATCLDGETRGALQDCTDIVSLSKGAHVFAVQRPTTGSKRKVNTRITLGEMPRKNDVKSLQTSLGARVFYERQTSERPALHLADVVAPTGAPASPACSMLGGVSRLTDNRCVAATNATEASTLRAFAATPIPYPGTVYRRTLTVPAAVPLPRGVSELSWTTASAAYTLPTSSYRVEVTLPVGAWAVITDKANRAVDVCASTAVGLSQCVLRGRGGALVLVRPEGIKLGQARVAVFSVEGPARDRLALEPSQEVIPDGPGTVAFRVSPSNNIRDIHVDSATPVRCSLWRDDGVRQDGCHVGIPASVGANLVVDHSGAPLRAQANRRGWHHVARFAHKLPRKLGPGLAVGDVVPLSGTLVDRTVVIDKRSVLTIAADSGVCALFSGRRTFDVKGLGGPCQISRLVDPGPHRVMVRAFADRPLFGTLHVTQTPLLRVGEGVAAPAWVSPGEERFFRFDAQQAGTIGVGLQTPSDDVECTLYDAQHRAIATGCQMYRPVERGGYLLGVRAPKESPPVEVRPVVLGLSGGDVDVPESYLEKLRGRVGGDQ